MINRVFIPTKSRAENLSSCVSQIEGQVSSFKDLRVLVNEQGAHRADLMGQRVKSRIKTIARNDVLECVKVVAQKTRLDEKVIRFSLTGSPFDWIPAYGASRNVGLMLTLGKKFISIDDDVKVSLCKLYNSNYRVVVRGGHGPQWHVHQIADDLSFNLPQPSFPHIINLMDRWLGKDVRELDLDQSFLGECCEELKSYVRSGDGCVAITQCGSFGRSPLRSNHSRAFSGCSCCRDNFFSHTVLAGMSGLEHRPDCERFVNYPIISHSEAFVSTFYAACNDDGLVPFFPVGRGEDQAFMRLMSILYPSKFIVDVPASFGHFSGLSNLADARPASISELTLTSIFAEAIAIARSGIGTNVIPAGAVAKFLMEVSINKSRFLDFYAFLVGSHISRQAEWIIGSAERDIRIFDICPYYVERELALLECAKSLGEKTLPSEFRGGASASVEDLRWMIFSYALVISDWKCIVRTGHEFFSERMLT